MVTSEKDKRAPGKMKQEYIGDGVVALCPKSYICFRFDGTRKLSHKGVQKVNNIKKHYHINISSTCDYFLFQSNDLTAKHYYEVLNSQRKHWVTNRGIWFRKNKCVKYTQKKSGLPYLITKMKTEADGITLTPLDEPEDGVDCMDICENLRETNRKHNRDDDFMNISDVSDDDDDDDDAMTDI